MSSLEMGMCLSFVVIAECAGVFNWGSHKIGSLDCLGGGVFLWILGCRVFLVNCGASVLHFEMPPLQSFKKEGEAAGCSRSGAKLSRSGQIGLLPCGKADNVPDRESFVFALVEGAKHGLGHEQLSDLGLCRKEMNDPRFVVKD